MEKSVQRMVRCGRIIFEVGFVVDYVVICVCSVASCNACYLILDYL